MLKTFTNLLKMATGNQSQQTKVAKTRLEVLKADVIPDIEDSVQNAGIIKSQFFSPIQTRQQRRHKSEQKFKININKLKKDPSVKMKSAVKDEPETIIKKISKSTIKPEEKFAEEPISDDKKGTQWEPKLWQQILKNIHQMRLSTAAPVDTMGCHQCSDVNADEKTQRFHKLVALMLSSQTKDETTYAAMLRLKANGLIPESIVSIDTTQLEDLLRPVSFYKNKAKYLQLASRILIDKYDSDIPKTVKELVDLPGVGPKMAHLCMSTAWNEVTGIGVDVHVHRIANRLRWVPKETKEPEQTRIALESWLPRDLWSEVNHLLVGFGQTVCTPLRPHCGDCLNRNICPSADKSAKKKSETVSDNHGTIPPIKKAKFQKKKINL